MSIIRQSTFHHLSKRQLLKAMSLASAMGLPTLAQSNASSDFSFVLIGDTPYTTLDEYSIVKVIQEASAGASFMIHVGDIKNGRDLCTDELLTRRMKLLDASPIPLIYLPGDNEWVDCRMTDEAPFDPINRLQFVRKLAFSSVKSLGAKKIDTQFQTEYPEHRSWDQGGVQFISLNVAGSYNGVGILSQASIDARMKAVKSWLELGVDQAIQTNKQGLVVAIHANIGVNRDGFRELKGKSAIAFSDFRKALLEQFKRWGKPCLLLHGDSHSFSNDKPIDSLPLLQRVESFGFPFTSAWARISVVHQNPALFVVSANHL
jgi:hypothetical protein